MNDERFYTEALDEIRVRKPHLVGFFLTAVEHLSKKTIVDRDVLSAIKKLTYASEYLFINVEALLPSLMARNELGLFSDILYDLALLDLGLSHAFLILYPSLKFPLERIGKEIVLFARSCTKRVKRAEKTLVSVLADNDPGKCSYLLSQWAVVAYYSPAALTECMTIFHERSKSLPWQLAVDWIERGIDLLSSGRTDEGIQFLMLRRKESRTMLGINHAALDDFKSVLKIYCASLCGYDMSILPRELSLYGLGRTYTDGTSIFLPETIGFFTEPAYNERVFTALAALQAASVLMGSFSFDLAKIDFKDELRERYAMLLPKIAENVAKQYKGAAHAVRERADGELEVVFKNNRRLLVLNTDHEKLFYSFPTPDFAKELFALIENSRIEAALSGLYPGLEEDFALLDSFIWRARPPVHVELQGDKAARFLACVECLVQFSLVGKYKAEIRDPSFSRIVDSIENELEKIYRPETTVQDTAGVLFSIYNIFYDNFPLVSYCSRYDVRESFPGADKPGFFPEIVADVSPELFPENAESNVLEDLPTDKERAIDLGSTRRADKKMEDLKDAISKGDIKVYRYPEYNYLKNAYEKNHCTLFESTSGGVENDYYSRIVREHKLVYKRIKKRFLYMKPDELEISRRWLAGDDINISDALDYAIALKRGEAPDEKVYYRKIKDSRDVAVAILVDASSSTDTTVEGMRVIDIEKAALSLLASALDLVGDPFGVFSFCSQGRSRVFVNVVKDFDEAWNAETQARIGSLAPNASNRDGCAIRHVGAKLVREEAKTRLLILLSDGIPADIDYGSGSSSETSGYAIEDTRRAILECRKLNIVPFCLTIDKYAKKYVSRLYGDYHFALLSDVTKLPERLSQLYLRLTR